MISTGFLRNIHFTTTLQQKLYSIIFNIIGLHWNVDNVGKRLISHFLDFLYNLTYAQFLGGGVLRQVIFSKVCQHGLMFNELDCH